MKHLKTIISVLVMFAALSCAKNNVGGSGLVSFNVANNQVVADVTKSNVSDYTALPESGDYTITILNATSNQVWTGKICDWPVQTLLPAGEYTVSAVYGSLEEEGFDKPYFYGSTTFTVTGKETAEVAVPVSLGNTIMKIACSENFKNYYKDYSFKLVRNNQEIAAFTKDDERAAFIDGYKIGVQGVLTGEIKTQNFSAEYTGLAEATAYTLYFDVPNVGGSTITISFNDTVETIELGDYELND